MESLQNGQKPEVDPIDDRGQRIPRHGFNSPFEEFALAMELSRKGIPTVYPRAVYMGGHVSELPEDLYDASRYESRENVMLPEGFPLLQKDRDYFLIWGYWNGPDERLAAVDRDYYESMSALHAYRSGLLNEERYLSLMNRYRKMLAEAHMEDLNLKGSHLLLSFRSSGELVEDALGEPEIRVCNFELLRRVQQS